MRYAIYAAVSFVACVASFVAGCIYKAKVLAYEAKVRAELRAAADRAISPLG